MLGKIQLFFFFFSLAWMKVDAQSLSPIKYIGVINVEKVGTFSYQLSFDVKNGVISGNTLTNSGNNSETQASITGSMNAKGGISFSETGILTTSVNAKNTSFCLVHASLSKKIKAGIELLEGPFTGKDKNGNSCGSGYILLKREAEESQETPKILEKSEVKDSVYAPNPQGKIKQLSTVSLNKVYCSGKFVEVRIYDAGGIDGDEVDVMYNGRTLASAYSLTKEGRVFSLSIDQQADNMLLLKTINEGDYPPNTATIDIKTSPNSKAETYQFNAKANTTIAIQLVVK